MTFIPYRPHPVGLVPDLSCGTTPTGYTSNATILGNAYSSDYSSHTGKIYFGGDGDNNNTLAVIELTPGTGAMAAYGDNQSDATRSGVMVCGSSGSVTNDQLLVVLEWPIRGISDRYVATYDLTDDSTHGYVNIGSSNCRIYAESFSYVYLGINGAGCRVLRKSDGAVPSIMTKAGWDCLSNNPAGCSLSDGTALLGLVSDTDNTRFGLSKVSGTSYGSVNEITEVSFDSITGLAGNGVEIGGSVYWPINVGSKTRCLITDTDGNYVDDFAVVNSAQAPVQFSLDSVNSCLFFNVGNSIYRINTKKKTVTNCSIGTPSGWSTPSYQPHGFYHDSNYWVYDNQLDGNSVAMAKKAVY